MPVEDSTLQISSHHPFFNRRNDGHQHRARHHYRHHNQTHSQSNPNHSQSHQQARVKVLPTTSLLTTTSSASHLTRNPRHSHHLQPSPPAPPPPPPPPPPSQNPQHNDARRINGQHKHYPQHPHHHHTEVPNGYQPATNGDDHSPSRSGGGEGGRTSSSGHPQLNYSFLKRICHERGILFEDANFVAGNRSLFGKKESPSNSSACNFLVKILPSIVWMRPHEICSRPKFIGENLSRFDVEQGEAIFALTACGKPTTSSSGGNSASASSHHHTLHHLHPNSDLSFGKTSCSSLLSAISCLTLTPNLLDRVVPSDQSFTSGHYNGIFRFRFWRFGEWTEVIIDDRLPTYKGRLLFLRSVDPTEFWAALLEKAYAKLYGNYEHYLKNCFTAQTLQDLTGGIAQSFTIPHHDGHIIYQMVSSAVPRSTLLSACISTVPSSEGTSPSSMLSHPVYAFSTSSSSALSTAIIKLQPCRLRNGLITRQSYSVTGLARVRTSSRALGLNQPAPYFLSASVAAAAAAAAVNGGPGAAAAVAGTSGGSIEVVLIRLRNAWGKGEWNGPWSERSWEWDTLSEQDKQELSARCREDGEFWMSFDDFLRYFTHLDLVHIGPDDWMNETSLHHKRPWRAVLARRRWRLGFNAGGSPSHKETFATNPQFHIHIAKNGLNKCHVVVSVIQYYITNPMASNTPDLTAVTQATTRLLNAVSSGGSRGSGGGGCVGSGRDDRHGSTAVGHNLHHIGFCVYEVPPGMKRLTPHFVTAHKPLDVTAFTATRETVTFFTLPPGDFIIVPSTEKPHCETKFLLRILTDEPSSIWEVNDDNTLCKDLSIPRAVENTGQNGQSLYVRLVSKLPPEIDAFLLFKVLKAYYKPLSILYDKPSIDLCRSLIMLKDQTISGKLVVKDSLASLLNMLHFWRTVFTKYQIHDGHHKVSSYNFRLVLWEAGISVSNKVLECLVIRYANSSAHLTLDSYLISLVKLHLAHDRYRSLEKKGKNPNLTLEEMILLTAYS